MSIKHEHQTAPQKPITVAQWAEANKVDLAPIGHVFNGVVEDITKLDSMIQGVKLTQPEAVPEKPFAEPVTASDRQKLADEIGKPYTSAGVVDTAFVQDFSAIQQASRNLRSKVQALVVG
jgi:hypothetical protein